MNTYEKKCFGKARHKTKHKAEDAKHAYEKDFGDKIDAYHCEYCDGWHIGHKHNKKEKMIDSLMMQTVDVWRPSYVTDVAEQLGPYSLIYSGIPASIQPAASNEVFFYSLRGVEVSHTIYSTATTNLYKRNDLIAWTDMNGVTHEFHVIADPLNGLFLNLYVQFTCMEYPEAQKRLNKEYYARQ